MSDTYKITQLAVYNPQRLDDDTFIDLFIARTKVFDYLVSQIKEEDANSIAQHHLIIGARGMGKTMLLKRIEIELKKTELDKTFIPILYPEEQYNITGLDDLWLNSLDKVADIMDYLKNDKLVNKIDIKVDALQGNKNKAGHEDEAYEFFLEITSELGKRPILLIDNINLIFKRLDKTDQHRLRNLLSKKNAPIIIAASPVKVKDALDYGAPFYDAFQIQYLQKLNDDELIMILNKLAELTGNKEILPELRQKVSRIKVINKLTGGVPRTSVMLFKLISGGFSNNIIEDLDALLDDITPLYKARFEEELSDQLQTIMNAIAINWDPISLEKLRTNTGLSSGKLSPQLKRLTESGWIVNRPGYQTKGKVYEVSERFFNIWFLMRQGSRRNKRQVLYLSKFLDSIYGEEIKTGANRLLTLASTKPDHILYNLAVVECINDVELKKLLIEKCRKDIIHLSDSNPEIYKQIDAILHQYEESKADVVMESFQKSLDELEKSSQEFGLSAFEVLTKYFTKDLTEKEIVKRLIEALQNDDNLVYYWTNLGNLNQDHVGNYEEAEKCYKKAIEIDPNSSDAWNGLGNLYQYHLSQYKESKKCYKEALKNDANIINPIIGLGNLYQYHFNHNEESEKCYKKALNIDSKSIYALNNLGVLYKTQLGNYEESEKCFYQVLNVDPKNVFAYGNLGNLYQYNLRRYQESEKCYKKALGINPKYFNALNGLGNLYQDHLKQFNSAKDLYLKALKIEPEYFTVKLNLIFLLRDKLDELNEARELFKSIKDYDELNDSYFLNATLFDLYDKNVGLAEKNLKKALDIIGDKLPVTTQDDWWRFAAVTHKLGFDQWLLNNLEAKGYDKILSPYYVVIKALSIDDGSKYLGSKAVEVREAAGIVLDKIKGYL